MFLLSELAGYESGFLINLLITTIWVNWVNDHFLPSFIASCSIPYPRSIHPPLKFSVKSIIVKWLVEDFSKICYIFEVQWFKSLLQCVLVTDFYKSNLCESPTNYICSKVILDFFYIPKVILKLNPDGNLDFFKLGFTPCRLNSHYKAWSYQKKKHKKIKTYRKSLQYEPTGVLIGVC